MLAARSIYRKRLTIDLARVSASLKIPRELFNDIFVPTPGVLVPTQGSRFHCLLLHISRGLLCDFCLHLDSPISVTSLAIFCLSFPDTNLHKWHDSSVLHHFTCLWFGWWCDWGEEQHNSSHLLPQRRSAVYLEWKATRPITIKKWKASVDKTGLPTHSWFSRFVFPLQKIDIKGTIVQCFVWSKKPVLFHWVKYCRLGLQWEGFLDRSFQGEALITSLVQNSLSTAAWLCQARIYPQSCLWMCVHWNFGSFSQKLGRKQHF